MLLCPRFGTLICKARLVTLQNNALPPCPSPNGTDLDGLRDFNLRIRWSEIMELYSDGNKRFYFSFVISIQLKKHLLSTNTNENCLGGFSLLFFFFSIVHSVFFTILSVSKFNT